MLHACYASLLRCVLRWDVDVAEEAEEGGPEDEEHPVPAERPVALDERDAVDEDGEGGKAGDDFGEYPFAVDIAAVLVSGLGGVVEVDAV